MVTQASATHLYDEPDIGQYAADMVKRVLVGIQEFRDKIGMCMNRVEKGEHSIVGRRGKPIAAVVPIEWYREAAAALNDPTEF